MKVKLDRKDPEKEKDEEGHPRTRPRSFYEQEKSPDTRENKEENPSLGKEGNVRLAKEDAEGVGDKDRNEGKVKGSTHLRPGRANRLKGSSFSDCSKWPSFGSLLIF